MALFALLRRVGSSYTVAICEAHEHFRAIGRRPPRKNLLKVQGVTCIPSSVFLTPSATPVAGGSLVVQIISHLADAARNTGRSFSSRDTPLQHFLRVTELTLDAAFFFGKLASITHSALRVATDGVRVRSGVGRERKVCWN